MRIRKQAGIAVLAIAVLGMVGGCALLDDSAPPRDKYIETQEAFIVAVGAVVDSKRAGLIDQGRYDSVVLPLVVEGDKILDSMRAMVDAGSYDQVELLRQSLLSIIVKLQLERA